MKSLLKHSLMAVAAVAAFASCQENEVYDSEVTRNLTMTLDGNAWNVNYDPRYRPLFIYNTDGSYVANYSSNFRFSLPSGSYRIVATNQSEYIVPPTNLNDQYIEQDPEAKKNYAISDPVDYTAGQPLNIELKTRTGMLRLHSIDTKADRSYSIVHAVVTTPVVAYHVGGAAPSTGDPIQIERYRETAGGGVGYNEEMYLIGSENDKVNVLIEYLDADSNIVNTKPFAEGITVMPGQITEVNFELNDPNEPVIINYTVSMGSIDWRENPVFPSVKVDVPEGYTYVEPGADLAGVIADQLADASIDELRIFLKANASYTLPDKALEGITKPITILGQTPGYGQSNATLQLVYVTMTGNIDHIRFENLTLKPQRDRIFNLRNQKFNVGEIAFVNCGIDTWSGSMWGNTAAADNEQTVGKVVMDNCRLTNITTSGEALWNVTTRRITPMLNWEFKNTLFHARNFGTKDALLTGLTKQTGAINVNIEGCTFIDPRGTNATYFNINGAAASSTTVSVRNCLVAGSKNGVGTWFSISTGATVNASGNLRAKGYEMKAYGIDTPAESDKTYNDILSQFNL